LPGLGSIENSEEYYEKFIMNEVLEWFLILLGLLPRLEKQLEVHDELRFLRCDLV
jgi:hypothetical protein